jgi:hypothetical protein
LPHKGAYLNNPIISQNNGNQVKNKTIDDVLYQGVSRLSYLEYKTQVGGGIVPEDIFYKSLVCGKWSSAMQDMYSGARLYVAHNCYHWSCPKCGGKDGNISQRRKRTIKRNIEIEIDDIEKIFLRQFVLTVPMQIRDKFRSARMLSNLMKSAHKQINKYFDGYQIIYLHLFGDKSEEFNPHINVHIIEKKEAAKYKISLKTIDEIKEWWLKVLKGHGYKGEAVDIKYSFRVKIKNILHAIKYMSKPFGMNDPERIKKGIKNDEILKKLLFEDLKNFRSYRQYNKKREKKEGEKMVSKKELEKIMIKNGIIQEGDSVYWQYQGEVPTQEIFLRHRKGINLFEVAPTVYISTSEPIRNFINGKKKKE